MKFIIKNRKIDWYMDDFPLEKNLDFPDDLTKIRFGFFGEENSFIRNIKVEEI